MKKIRYLRKLRAAMGSFWAMQKEFLEIEGNIDEETKEQQPPPPTPTAPLPDFLAQDSEQIEVSYADKMVNEIRSVWVSSNQEAVSIYNLYRNGALTDLCYGDIRALIEYVEIQIEAVNKALKSKDVRLNEATVCDLAELSNTFEKELIELELKHSMMKLEERRSKDKKKQNK